MITFKHFLFWLPMIVLAFANATIRQLVFIKYFDEWRAHQLSTLTLSIFCAVYIWLIFPWLHVQNQSQALWIGLLWMVLTILFEFALGILLKRPLPELLQQYNILSGHTWPVFLIILFVLPYIFYALKKQNY